MHLVKLSPFALALATGPNAGAQVEGQATWLWNVTTDNGDAIVEPGELAVISMAIDMTPDVNYPDGPVLGFAGVAFNLIGSAEAHNGQVISWQVSPGLTDVFGELGTTDGVNMFNVHAAQLHEVFIPADPISVFELVWQPSRYANYTVAYSSTTWNPFLRPNQGTAGIWTGTDLTAEITNWPIAEAAIIYLVVPSPATAILFLLPAYSLLSRSNRQGGIKNRIHPHPRARATEIWLCKSRCSAPSAHFCASPSESAS